RNAVAIEVDEARIGGEETVRRRSHQRRNESGIDGDPAIVERADAGEHDVLRRWRPALRRCEEVANCERRRIAAAVFVVDLLEVSDERAQTVACAKRRE